MTRTLLALALVSLTSCSLVTVPVKTAGSVANTAITTTGKVLREPFR
jgi:hypothetical protein